MKKVLALALALVLVLSAAGCGLFSDDSIVQFEELYTHKDPEGLKYDARTALINRNFGTTLEENVNMMAYPDTVRYDEEGNIVGIYDYDPETGLASGWMDTATGEFVAGEVDLGKPDESLMIHLKGSVVMGCVVYGNEDKAIYACLYAFLADAADKDVVAANLEQLYGLTMTAESETVLVCKQDEAFIDAQFLQWQELYGQIQSDRSAAGYAENLKLEYGLSNYGVNPYKPCSEMSDPTDLTFDDKAILTCKGDYSFVDQSLEKELTGRTDVIYGLDGEVVGHHTYYEFSSKAAADKLMDAADTNLYNPVRVSDTVVLDRLTGSDLQDLINAYIGYNVLTDASFEGYIANVEGTFFAMRYEQ